MIHAFDDEVAVVVGVKGAILLNHLAWWVRKNEASGINFHDGYYWTYNTSDAYSKIFPFFSADVIRKELKNLEKAGYILSGCYNKSAMNRTKWYTLTDEGRKLTKCNRIADRIEADNCPNPSGQNQETSIDSNIPVSNKHNNKGEACSPKVSYAESVSMTEEEHNNLLQKLGSTQAVDWCIEKLNNYKLSSGKKYKSDYRAILSWVLDSLPPQFRRVAATPVPTLSQDEQEKRRRERQDYDDMLAALAEGGT